MRHSEFRELVAEALDDLPEEFADHLWNLEVLVRQEPSAEDLATVGLGSGSTLFGLYQGVPLTERGSSPSGALPDVITIFQGPIERRCRGREECVRRQVRETLRHEIAHYFGISDDRLTELGAY